MGAINRFLNPNPYETRIEDKDAARYVIARRVKDLPDDVAWEVVDIAQRIRIALDKAMIDLVIHNERGTSGVGFPFGGIDRATGQPSEFPGARLDHIKKKLTCEQWEFIIAQRPHPGGNETLWSINEVANSDKHRQGLVRVIPRLSQDVTMGIGPLGNVARIDCIEVMPSKHDFPLADKERETVLIAKSRNDTNFRVDQTITAAVIFGNVEPVEGKNVLTTLNEQMRTVQCILKGFRGFFR